MGEMSCNWLCAPLQNGVDQGLSETVDKEYEDTPIQEKRGVRYLKLLLEEMYQISQEIVSALQS